MVDGYPIEFDRRWYGRGVCYTWAYIVLPSGDWLSVGDPYPATAWKRDTLENYVRSRLETL